MRRPGALSLSPRAAVLAILAVVTVVAVGGLHAAFAAASVEPVRRILRLPSGRVETVPLEAYVAAVLPAEIGGRSPADALAAQAVAARSYALARTARHEDRGADLCDGVHCQVFRGLGTATPASLRAVEATRGLVLAQGGKVIAAPFHAVCGGRTARPSDVWDDEETPELEPVEDDACRGADGAAWLFRLPRREIPALASALGFPEGRYLEVWGRDATGRVSAVRLAAPGGASRTVRGFEFRKAASALWGWGSIRSTLFSLEETRTEYLLSGRGTGHGAGLCQSGAIERARRGETWREILAFYYRGAEVVPLESLDGGRGPVSSSRAHRGERSAAGKVGR